MERTPGGGTRFSFTRFINNAVPNLALAPQVTELNIAERDALFVYQVSASAPEKLVEESYIAGGITSSTSVSAKIHRALLKNGVIVKDTGRIDTSKVTKNFAHQLSHITSHAQKKLIDMLFFWEEEMMRLNVLRSEAEELKVVIEEEKKVGDGQERVGGLEKRAKELEGLLKLKPSLRGEQVRENEQLPGYVESSRPGPS
ncbi:hypothetical protein K491DRAFT_692498 [Lophiostoma macrostomum CBS 122681]|uniref:Uncharacterized protein n=1 Tax=Lophiostoma macrostomum CBS 122681 TaxID=1314788 RepID=A0A6A6TAA9_9PLEO|nr:hypothetical protein K491DRAFT_692498 [Lophiostoma macrostomum CBS 122681]